MTDNPITKILSRIEDFLSLKRGEIEKGKEISEDIGEIANIILDIPMEEELEDKLSSTITENERLISKFSKDVTQSKEGELSLDWKRIAENDMIRLKDEILILQDLIKKNEKTLRKRFDEKKYGTNIEDLIDRLENTDEFDEVLKSKLKQKIETVDENKLREKLEKSSDIMTRISEWILKIKEVDNVDR